MNENDELREQLHRAFDGDAPRPEAMDEILATARASTRREHASHSFRALLGRRAGRVAGTVVVTLVVAAAATSAIVVGLRAHPSGYVPGESQSPSASPSSSPRSTLTPPRRFVQWLPLAPRDVQPAAPVILDVPTPAPGTPACTASQLKGTYLGEFSALGNPDTPILVQDKGTSACYLDGYADVRILDASAHVLASAVGTAGRGTYFDQFAAIPVLLEPGTGAPSADRTNAQDRGDAFMNVEYWNCTGGKAATVALDLPNSGGRLLVPYPVSPYSPACEPGGEPAVSLSRGPLSAAGYAIQSTPILLRDTESISAPQKVVAGSTLTYYVTIGIAGQSSYDLRQCPDYYESLQPKLATEHYQLNCSPVGSIAPGSSATFQMRLSIPGTLFPGSYVVNWSLLDPRLSSGVANATIEVVSG